MIPRLEWRPCPEGTQDAGMWQLHANGQPVLTVGPVTYQPSYKSALRTWIRIRRMVRLDKKARAATRERRVI